MIHDICLHGTVGDRYEFYTTVIGTNLNVRFFYEYDTEQEFPRDRFFSGGNEICLHDNRLAHRGTGGSFCPYMYGVERPLKDLLKRDVCNRLVMYGARIGDMEGRLGFTGEADGAESYERIFREGHVLTNYFFFISGDVQGGVRGAQEMILRLAGKFLKRYDLTTEATGAKLAKELYAELGIPKWSLFLVRLTDLAANSYATLFRDLHRTGKPLKASDRSRLDQEAKQRGISWSQQERIEISVASEFGESAGIISQYEEILVAHYTHNLSDKMTLPKLTRLRALGARRMLPPRIFDQLDKMLLHKQSDQPKVEPEYVREVRRILQSFFVDGAPDATPDLLVRLMHYKRQAVENRSLQFENALAELTRDSEGWQFQTSNEAAIEAFHGVIANFDRFDTLSAIINGVAFIDDFELTEERLYTLARNQVIFENIRENLFTELFFEPIKNNRYLNAYGRQRLEALSHGIKEIVHGEGNPKPVIEAIAVVNQQLYLRRTIDGHVRRLVRDIYKNPLDKSEHVFLRNTVNRQMLQDGVITENIPEELFNSVLLTIREECLYLNELLPQILSSRDRRLREDFLENSGLDRFRIEEIEQHYLQTQQMPTTALDFLMDMTETH
ncbi:MAG: TIGR04442 family protein [Blastocatellia bacterium]|nr:TIGR04442 family protein [Blastocatellia bacterium]